MKKLMIIVIAFLTVGLIAVAVPLALRYDTIQYEKNMMAHVISCSSGDLVAEYSGQKILVQGRNIDRIASVLTTTDRRRILYRPDFNVQDAIVLTFPDGAVFRIIESDKQPDTIYWHYANKGQNRYLVLTGYDAINWLKRAISLEGIYNENKASS